MRAAGDTLGNLLTLHVAPASDQDRAQACQLADTVQEATGDTVKTNFADQGYAGDEVRLAMQADGITMQVVKHSATKRRFVLLLRRWVVERGLGWAARLQRLVRDYERSAKTRAGYLTLPLFSLYFVGSLLPTNIS
jgi:transposase